MCPEHRAGGCGLLVGFLAVAHETAIFDAKWIMMRPVHQPAQVVPLVEAADEHPIAHAERHAAREVNVMRDQQRLPLTDVDNEALVALAIVVVG